ncbi:aminopeptidase N [Pelagibaculum spongiae]|uniref:Aminopeptidase N n=1 Tax=Pelagibaculum spongiae TaxID=2080658 RepID=A0A2V1H326_9GAMM|nr:aminopeptidase N [Pelagibaculum spongiae]PVZ71577.1 aminopeptidase N [Pelagibaculum spongiae]
MQGAQPEVKYLKDYKQPDYLISDVALTFKLDETETLVSAKMNLNATGDASQPLRLDGEKLELLSLSINGQLLNQDQYAVDDEGLTIHSVPAEFVLESQVRIHPETNTELEGLYQSSGNFCTQCEAEGFRKITYYQDRPDVMAKFITRVEGDKSRYPVLLSNGNLIEQGELDGGRHFATWQDPFVKPAYLFALVAGQLEFIQDSYTTISGREVDLRIYVESQNIDKCDHAMESLKKSMKWDEDTFGLEYDLDIYMIVAVNDFNMGAMENKGLNVFNSKFVLAKPETATDTDYEGIEGVIGHEYFHNWTGNRVTCRDWFQLSLKEGLTVFRDQEFSSDMNARSVKRIEDVAVVRAHQFPEDDGPMSHPIRPASYIEMNNFYTVTVYQKGGEVIRMYQTLLGKDGFRKGMDLYFKRHDGQAVTCDDFLSAMQDATGVDLSRFSRWYAQAGTPRLTVRSEFANGTFSLKVSQATPATPGQEEKLPFHIPLRFALLDGQGNRMPLNLQGSDKPVTDELVLDVLEAEQTFVFSGLAEKPVPSLLRGFSAPVIMDSDLTDQDQLFLAANDDDEFNRWEAIQQLAINWMLDGVAKLAKGESLQRPQGLVEALAKTLVDESLNPALRALALGLPAESVLAEKMDVVDPDAIHQVRSWLRQDIATAMTEQFKATYLKLAEIEPTADNASSVRRLKNCCLGYLTKIDSQLATEKAQVQFAEPNMTNVMAGMSVLVDLNGAAGEQALVDFYAKWQADPLVTDKWFMLQASAGEGDTLAKVKGLLEHKGFDIRNPNKVRSLIGVFARNQVHFHRADGEGYRFIADRILELDAINPQIAARLAGSFLRWKKFDSDRQKLMKAEMERMVAAKLSKNTYEIISKSLA